MTEQVTTTPEESQVETSQVSEQETPVVENQTLPEEATAQPTEPVEEQQQTPVKPTRAEKRLHQLLEKGKPNQSSYTELMAQLPEVQPSEDGTITPEQLQQIVAQETAKNIKLHQETQEYAQKVHSFTSEVEEVGNQIDQDFKDNPKVAERINNILTKNLQAANVRIDSNGREYLVPVLSAKEAYQELKDTLSLMATQGTAQATAKMAQQIAEGAVTPSSRQPEEANLTELTAAEIFKNPTAVREALEKKLSRA